MWAAGHRFAWRTLHNLCCLAATPSLRSATRGPLTANDTATGERWQDGFARRAHNKPPVPRDELAAAVDLSQSHLGAVLALLQYGDDDAVRSVAYLLTRTILADTEDKVVPGWEVAPLLLRAGLLPLVAAVGLREGLADDPMYYINSLLSSLKHCIHGMVARYTATDNTEGEGTESGDDTNDKKSNRPRTMTAFQRRWLRESVVEPVLALCSNKRYRENVEKWLITVDALRDLVEK